MRGKRHYRKFDPLLLLVVAVTLGAVMTTAVNAAEPSMFIPHIDPAIQTFPIDSYGYRIAQVHDTGAVLHISMSPPPEINDSFLASGGREQGLGKFSDVFLSIRYPW
jgi:hypothetical protein